MKRIAIVGTGLIGASVGLALKATGCKAEILGFDSNPQELATAQQRGAVDARLSDGQAVLTCGADIYVLATPVLPVMDWMERLATVPASTLVTDTGSTKLAISELAAQLYNAPDKPQFLPGHPMAGKESGGAALADAALFRDTTWLFTPLASDGEPLAAEWRQLVQSFGANICDLEAAAHDELCAWVSHLPQMLSTALAAMLEETFSADPAKLALLRAIGGRALRETTRLGASPYSMWRDVALTNTDPIAATLLALEQRLAHVRENLRTPELREEFRRANQFRAPAPLPDKV